MLPAWLLNINPHLAQRAHCWMGGVGGGVLGGVGGVGTGGGGGVGVGWGGGSGAGGVVGGCWWGEGMGVGGGFPIFWLAMIYVSFS